MEDPHSPIDNTDDLRRQKAMLLTSIDSEIINDSVSEAILDSLERLEQIYRQENIQITEWMKDAYRAVALHCSFRRLLENFHPENGNSPALESILDSRVSKLEMLNSELLTDVLRDCEKGFRVLLSNSDALNNWKEKSQEFKYYALTLTRFFVTAAMSATEPELVENKEIGTDEEAEEDEITAESHQTMDNPATEVEFLQGEDKAMEERGDWASNKQEGKDRDGNTEAKEDENQQMMDKADTEVEFLQEEAEAREERASSEKEASAELKHRDDNNKVKEDEITAENQLMMDKADTEVEFLQEEAEAREKRNEMAFNEKEGKDRDDNKEAKEDEIRAENQQMMDEEDNEVEFLQEEEDKAREKRDEVAPNEKEGKDRDDNKEAKEDEIRAENQQMMDEEDTEVEFLQEEEDKAREKRDEVAPNEKEASSEGKDRVECEHSEVVGAKGKEIKVKRLLHKAAAPRRHYKRPSRIACSDDLDSDIDSTHMDTSEANQASVEIPLDSSDVLQRSAKEAVSNPSMDEPLEIRFDSPKISDVKQGSVKEAVNNPSIDKSLEICVDSSRTSNVKQSLEKAAVSNSSVDESCEIRLDSPKSIDVSPLKIYEGTKFAKRRKKNTWTPEEEDALREGVKKYGVGNWKMILNANRDMFSERLEVDLKDKWRNLNKWGRMSHIRYP